MTYIIRYAGNDWKEKEIRFTDKKAFLLFRNCLDRRIKSGTLAYYKSLEV